MLKKLKKTKAKIQIPVYFDLLFKKIFGNVNNTKPLRILLKRMLSIEPKEITILNSELINRPYKDKKTACDLIVELEDGTKINFEINTQVNQDIINRNTRLLCLNISKDLNPGEEYREIKSQIQINLDLKGNHIKSKEEYKIIEIETGKILTDAMTIIRYDIPYFKELCYTNSVNELDGLSRLLGLLGANNEEEVDYITKGDEELEEIGKQYKKYVNEEDVIGAYDYELHQRELARIEKEEAVAEALETAIKQSEIEKEEAVEAATKQNKIEIARNMLKKNFDNNLISQITGLTVKEVEELSEN